MAENDRETKIIALKREVKEIKQPSKGRFWLWALPVSLLIHGFLWLSADGLRGQEKSQPDRIQMVFHTVKPTPVPKAPIKK